MSISDSDAANSMLYKWQPVHTYFMSITNYVIGTQDSFWFLEELGYHPTLPALAGSPLLWVINNGSVLWLLISQYKDHLMLLTHASKSLELEGEWSPICLLEPVGPGYHMASIYNCVCTQWRAWTQSAL